MARFLFSFLLLASVSRAQGNPDFSGKWTLDRDKSDDGEALILGGIGSPDRMSVVIASKQLYFSHYFHTGLELITLVTDRDHPDDGFYLVALNRYRTDLPGGLFGKMARKVAEDGARGSTERYLKATQGAIEKYFRDERGR